MKCHLLGLVLLILSGKPLSGQSTTLFDDTKVASIYLELPADSLSYILNNLEHNRYLQARFIFDDGQKRDTVLDVGLRLRGNTSLSAQKKSFKISFNAFEAGRSYQGVKKLNLRGQHNDPTMVREKLFYEVWKKADMPERRAAFVKLYINQEFRGLYTNLEEMDKTWLGRVYDDDNGNLFKCTYPADLVYLGPQQAVYKAIMNNPEERAYDLKTNETEDNYTRLVSLITALNQPINSNFPVQIRQILNVESVLKSFAIDVATGNWDDYFYNKNNYYLYDNPSNGRFEFVTFDTDNTFGVDWLGKDWAKRNCLDWLPAGQPRPLATKLLAVPEFQEKYIRYLDTLTRLITNPDTVFSRLDAMKSQISAAAMADPYRSLDYGYTFASFQSGFNQTIDSHTPYGIKPFLGIRYDSIRSQIAGLLSGTEVADSQNADFRIYPNPSSELLFIQSASINFSERVIASIYGICGQKSSEFQWEASEAAYAIPVSSLPSGAYVLHLRSEKKEARFVFLKGD